MKKYFFLRSLNISFAKLGDERCAKCELLQLTDQQGYQAHKDVAAVRRALYRADKSDRSICAYSMDMQKVMMLPR